MTSKSKKADVKDQKNAYSGIAKQIFYLIFIFTRILYDWLIDTVFWLFYKSEEDKRLPGVKENLVLRSALSLAEQIRGRKISSEKVIRAFIERAKEVNPALNAIIDDRYEEAIIDAKNVDKFLLETNLSVEEIKLTKPFLGVPFTSKEATSAEGMSFTFGMISRKDARATEDAPIVKRMKESGAILIAVTNVPELCMWSETRNNVFGQTNNPYNFTRCPGGSSGGEGAIISACGSPLGIGTDVGGSIRVPSHFCGIFGHKPTPGVLPGRGIMFHTGDEQTISTAGPIARYASDLLPMLRVLLGPDSHLLSLDRKVNIQDVKFYYCVNPSDPWVSPVYNEVVSGILKAVDHLSTVSKFHVDKVSLDGFQHSCSFWLHEMSKEPDNVAFDLSNRTGEVNGFTELLKLLVGKSQFSAAAIMWLLSSYVHPDKNWAEEKIKEFTQELLDLLGENGVLLFPSCPTDVPYHYSSLFRPFNSSYWSIFSALRFPVTQVPLGLNKNGLPTGLQVVAAPRNDSLTIAVAEELERAFGGWVPPFSN